MVAFNKFNDFTQQLVKGVHVFGTNVFKVMLTNSAPVATNTIKANITDIAAGNGYTAGGTATTITVADVLGTTTASGTQVQFTAAGGSIGPFRYAVLYNDSAASPVKPLVGWWDYGLNITLLTTESLIVKFNNTTPGSIFTLT